MLHTPRWKGKMMDEFLRLDMNHESHLLLLVSHHNNHSTLIIDY